MPLTPTTSFFAALTLTLLTACGVSDNLPSVAISSSTAAVVRVSTTGIGSETIQQSYEAIATIMAKSKIPQIVQASGLLQMQASALDPTTNERMRKIDELMESMRGINAKAIVVIADGNGVSDLADSLTDIPIGNEGITVLVQTTSTGSSADIQTLAAKAFDREVMVESLGAGWYWLKTSAGQTLPAKGDEAVAKAFDEALRALPLAGVNFGMRMTEDLKQKCAEAIEDDVSGMGMFLGGFVAPLQKLVGLSSSLNFGKDPTIRVALTFEDKDATGEFNQAWSTTTRSLAGMAGMMMAGGGKGQPKIEPKTFTDMAAALDMKQDETKLTLTLDHAAWNQLIP
ncbi:MAG: hypothetical protein EXS15_02465 [Phycisphaerales bacterium]|nr:hypothetical protein [Phycisphaerales bacterium]